MDHVDFLAPIELGDIVTVTGYVFDTGRTSMELKVDVEAARPSSNETRETASSFFTFVALDEDESATHVPELRCPTESERSLRDQALDERHRRRQELAAQVTDGPARR